MMVGEPVCTIAFNSIDEQAAFQRYCVRYNEDARRTEHQDTELTPSKCREVLHPDHKVLSLGHVLCQQDTVVVSDQRSAGGASGAALRALSVSPLQLLVVNVGGEHFKLDGSHKRVWCPHNYGYSVNNAGFVLLYVSQVVARMPSMPPLVAKFVRDHESALKQHAADAGVAPAIELFLQNFHRVHSVCPVCHSEALYNTVCFVDYVVPFCIFYLFLNAKFPSMV
eukprot:TRINITY_DN12816_c0_g1_i1.p1 TRINITY_DN12816_c0_g1~~TRINITY_DN12816_c0_g1_i1.p1  ORF type:complete len:224 (+),score=24.30 TRINITY_DN12816_c0_g1_i1:659-1330(+)